MASMLSPMMRTMFDILAVRFAVFVMDCLTTSLVLLAHTPYIILLHLYYYQPPIFLSCLVYGCHTSYISLPCLLYYHHVSWATPCHSHHGHCTCTVTAISLVRSWIRFFSWHRFRQMLQMLQMRSSNANDMFFLAHGLSCQPVSLESQCIHCCSANTDIWTLKCGAHHDSQPPFHALSFINDQIIGCGSEHRCCDSSCSGAKFSSLIIAIQLPNSLPLPAPVFGIRISSVLTLLFPFFSLCQPTAASNKHHLLRDVSMHKYYQQPSVPGPRGSTNLFSMPACP